MGYYEVRDYLNKKTNDIWKNSNETHAYSLGWASGIFELYKYLDKELGQEEADRIFKSMLKGKEEYEVIFRTLVGLYREENKTKANHILELMDKYKQSKPEMSDDERYLLECFMEFVYTKENSKEGD